MFDQLLNTRPGREMQSEAARARLERRQQHVDALAEIEATSAKRRAPLVAKRDAAQKAVKAAETAIQLAKAQLVEAYRDLTAHDHQARHVRDRHEQALCIDAAPELSAFLDQTGAERDRLTNHRLIEERKEIVVTGYSIATGPIRQLQTVDNMSQLAARLEALTDADQRAHAIATTAADVTGMDTLLADLPDYHLPQN